MRALALVFVLACSSTPRAPSAPPPPPPTPSDAAGVVAATPPAPGCPATFAAASGHCTTGDSCTYPEGVCSCAAPAWCGGAAPPPTRAEDLAWQCTPKVRRDGCPGSQPAGGTPCAREGQSCDYTCSCSLEAVCKAGQWSIERGPCKP